jgi:short-subunit dehydrogenase
MFENKVVAITGAGSGIGRALAINLANSKARLALSDINEQSLAETASLLPANSDCKTYIVDTSSREAVFNYADAVNSDFGFVDYIINNAGTAVLATVEHVTLEEIEKILGINLWGVIYGTKAFLPIMLKQKSGCIVNVSSVFGLVAAPGNVAYNMSKFAVRGLTETLWMELKDTGVNAVSVHPGGINTNITKSPDGQFMGAAEERMKKANMDQMTTTPEQCAEEIVQGLLSGRKRLLVGRGAKQLFWLSRLFPNSYGKIINR